MRRRGGKNRGGDGGSLWISFSDLMSALMLIFVLVLFYAVYQYYDMLEVKTAELLRQSGLLDEKSSQLTLSQQELEDKENALALAQQALDDKEAELNSQSLKLTETEQELLNQKAKLLLQEDTLNALQEKLAAQESELSSARVSLDEALAAQQTQKEQLDAQQAQLDKLVGVKSAIIEELVRALANSNISGAGVDDSGAIVFSTEMMFDVNRSTLKDVGKAFLNSFIPAYLDVLMSDDYSQYVSQIIIEGHTDTDGTYLSNLALSQERALAVVSYCLSGEMTGLSSAEKQVLQSIITANGRSYSDPVYAADGTVDKEASRRVVFKFRMKDSEMIDQMSEILEGQQED